MIPAGLPSLPKLCQCGHDLRQHLHGLRHCLHEHGRGICACQAFVGAHALQLPPRPVGRTISPPAPKPLETLSSTAPGPAVTPPAAPLTTADPPEIAAPWFLL